MTDQPFQFPSPFISQGWQCPKCQTIWAPHIPSCTTCLPPPGYTITTTSWPNTGGPPTTEIKHFPISDDTPDGVSER